MQSSPVRRKVLHHKARGTVKRFDDDRRYNLVFPDDGGASSAIIAA